MEDRADESNLSSATQNPGGFAEGQSDLERALHLFSSVESEWLHQTVAESRSWQDDALCAQTDPEAFFPEKGGSTREAKRICRACPVIQECLEYALLHDERFGIWGGLSERERRRLRGEINNRMNGA